MEKIGEASAYLEKTGRKVRAEFVGGVKTAGFRPRISRYALGPDYHAIIKERLGLMLSDIKAAVPGVEGKSFTDTSPVLEKELGRLSGLGFRGRNTLLISGELGSYIFIGGLALSLEYGAGESPVADTGPGCGNCGKCAAACPTGALKASGVLDAGLCISYWTTQSGTAAPEGIISKSGGYVYGCDLCQEVCPYNEKTPDRILLPEFNPNNGSR
jgi:epoxyqueuosine reductase